MDDKGRNFKNPQCGRVYDPEGLSPTLNTCNGGNRQPKVIVRTDKTICLNSKGGRGGKEGLQPSLQDRVYSVEGIATACTTCYPSKIAVKKYLPIKNATRKGYIEGYEGDYVNLQFPNSETRRGRVTTGYANTLLCNDAQGVITEELKIRKLTPNECFRLMGFDDRDVDTLRDNGISDAQLYKMAGNSIVVDVVYHIFEQLRSRYPDIFPRGQMSIEDLIREEV